jgi:hypothetical protein
MALVFLDFDDTLFPTSDLLKQNIVVSNLKGINCIKDIKLRNIIKTLEEQIIEILTHHENVIYCIVTNAAYEWITLCLNKIYCKLNTVIKKNNIEIISAIDSYSHLLGDNPMLWKYCAFKEVVNKHKINNILGLGDNFNDRQALLLLKDDLNDSSHKIKSIKFPEFPTTVDLQKQMELVRNVMATIIKHDGHLDLQLTITNNV